jgi:thiosulfate/3-mercaptopyruvate sulfurtransferase
LLRGDIREASMNTTLVSAAELAARLDDRSWLILDCRNELTDREAGRRAYAEGHIPGAHHVHLEETLSGPITGRSGRHPLPDPQVFTERMRGLGLDSGMQVAAYDAMGGVMASRLWWMLRWLGHSAVAVLDGGWKAWLDGGHPVSRESPAVRRGSFQGAPQANTVDAAFVLAHLGDPRVVVVDARAADRFRGENETLDPVGGHIPGARNRPYSENLTAQGTFKPPEQLREAFDRLLSGTPPGSIVHQCGSGVSACHNILAMEAAGLTGSRLYPGSWSEWCADASRPVARG